MSAVYGPVEHAVRSEIYRLFVDTGTAPSIEEVAAGVGLGAQEIEDAFQALDELHAIVLKPGTLVIERALPFSGSPTSHMTRAGGRDYWANCAWDALGISAALGMDAEIRSDGFAGGDTMRLEVRDGRLLGDPLLMGFVVPARNWWDDIGFTSSTILFFRSEEHVERWQLETQLAVEALLPMNRSWELARIWYHDRLNPDWRPKLRAELQGRLTWVGLMSDFWQL